MDIKNVLSVLKRKEFKVFQNKLLDREKNENIICELEEYYDCVSDLINSEIVQSNNQYIQHGNVTCLEHCTSVSLMSYKVCKMLNLDYQSAARGALLHDFFLYDWHIPGSHVGLHGFRHSKISLENAVKHFNLNEKEKDIILKHMWPLNIVPPKSRESLVVSLIDKFCSSKEIVLHLVHRISSVNMKKKI